jgi:hypothetical protein
LLSASFAKPSLRGGMRCRKGCSTSHEFLSLAMRRRTRHRRQNPHIAEIRMMIPFSMRTSVSTSVQCTRLSLRLCKRANDGYGNLCSSCNRAFHIFCRVTPFAGQLTMECASPWAARARHRGRSVGGQTRKWRRLPVRSVLPPTTDIRRSSEHVRLVPIPDLSICDKLVY